MIGLIQMLSFAASLLAFGTWLVVVALAPTHAPAGASARWRLRSRRAWLYAPLWVPAVGVAAMLTPGLLGALITSADHCLNAGAHHAHHLCLAHPPHTAHQLAAWVAPTLLLGFAAAALYRAARTIWRERRIALSLARLGRPSTLADGVRVLEQPLPWAATVGWSRPTILLTEGLLRRASPATLQVILAHEAAHAARRDNLLAALDRLAAYLLPQAVAAPLLDEIDLAREQACDDDAARQVGGALPVAQAIVEIARLRMIAPPVGLSVLSSTLEPRVAYLLSAPHDAPWRRYRALLLLALLALACVGPMHSASEHLLHLLLH